MSSDAAVVSYVTVLKLDRPPSEKRLGVEVVLVLRSGLSEVGVWPCWWRLVVCGGVVVA